MGKVFIEETTLTAIGNAIREQTGKSDLISPANMPTEIKGIESGGSGEGIPEEAYTITGDCSYMFSNGHWDWFIDAFGNKVSTKDIGWLNYMFQGSKAKSITFEINCGGNNTNIIEGIFQNCIALVELPKINNAKIDNMSSMFSGCVSLKTIPEDYFDNWDFSIIDGMTDGWSGTSSQIFMNCQSLRNLPLKLYEHGNPYVSPDFSTFSYMVYNCCVLDEIVNMPIPHYNSTWTYNAFNSTFYNCHRLKEMTFKMPNGSPYVVNWSNQTIDLSNYVGHGAKAYIVASGISEDKMVSDDATYQALKNDPDWFAQSWFYSRYNHDSAVNTINSLPDTSAFLATNGGTNTIKFKGVYGRDTDGGAIENLTEEEIAVATAKGWTVSFV